MDDATKQALLSAFRTLLVTGGAALASHGYIASASVDTVAGAVLVVITALWGVYDKYRSEAATKTRETSAVQAGVMAATNDVKIDANSITHTDAQSIIRSYAP